MNDFYDFHPCESTVDSKNIKGQKSKEERKIKNQIRIQKILLKKGMSHTRKLKGQNIRRRKWAKDEYKND